MVRTSTFVRRNAFVVFFTVQSMPPVRINWRCTGNSTYGMQLLWCLKCLETNWCCSNMVTCKASNRSVAQAPDGILLESRIDHNQVGRSYNICDHALVQSINRKSKYFREFSKCFSYGLHWGPDEMSVFLSKRGVSLTSLVVELLKNKEKPPLELHVQSPREKTNM